MRGVNAPQVRKDLSHLGSYGTRGVGYDVAYLLRQINRQLGLTEDRRVAIVGAGNLGQALASYGGFPSGVSTWWPLSTWTPPRSGGGWVRRSFIPGRIHGRSSSG